MNLEFETLKLRLIETQMQLLQYQHREITEAISKAQGASAQIKFDISVDAHDIPNGATAAPDEFAGS